MLNCCSSSAFIGNSCPRSLKKSCKKNYRGETQMCSTSYLASPFQSEA
jgi:hypothetical protein